MATISAADILGSSKSQAVPINYKHDDLQYDLGILAALDNHPLDPSALAKDKEKALLKAATENTQLLVKHFFELPIEVVDVGPVAVLPEVSIRLPRAMPLPKAKAPTRWEKFAKAKGIKPRKHASAKVLDEATGEWKYRWGPNRANDKSKDWAIQYKKTDDGAINLFEKQSLEKKNRILKNELNRVSNIERDETRKGDRSGKADTDFLNTPSDKKGKKGSKRERSDPINDGIPIGIAPLRYSEGKADNLTHNAKQPRQKVATTLSGVKEEKSVKQERVKIAQTSTASLGRFDRTLKGEPTRPSDPRSKKRLPNEVSLSSEQQRHEKVMQKIFHQEKDAIAERPSVSNDRPHKNKSKDGFMGKPKRDGFKDKGKPKGAKKDDRRKK